MKRVPFDVDNAIRRYLSGESAKNVGDSLGVSAARIFAALERAGVERRTSGESRKGRPSPRRIILDAHEIAAAYESGESELGIATRLGVSRAVIARTLTEAGVNRRGRQAAQALRMANATPEQRLAWSEAAHAATRGSVQPEERLARSAITRERNAAITSRYEREFAMMLAERAVEFVQQKAIGRYNADLATGPIAVEIYGGHWHFSGSHLERAERRLRKLADEGWHVLVIIVSADAPLSPGAADYLVTWLDEAEANPSAPREYRMIWGTGKLAISERLDADHLTVVYPRARTRDPATGCYGDLPR